MTKDSHRGKRQRVCPGLSGLSVAFYYRLLGLVGGNYPWHRVLAAIFRQFIGP